MKKLLLILLFISTKSFAESGECHRQRNPMGYTNYDICEVAETGYICVTLEGKSNSGISCFPAPKKHETVVKKETTHSRKHIEDAYDSGY